MPLDQQDFYLERPDTGQRTLLGQRTLPNAREQWFADSPRIGLVISTYGSAPFVELGLAANRKFCGNIPILVHDDASGEQGTLRPLCEKYSATFQCNSSRL